MPVLEPSPAPVSCITYPPTRGIYYDCNSDFISDADCFDGFKFTCQSCCYTDLSVDGRRPCWTPDHSKIDCCGEGSDIAPTHPPEFGDSPICGEESTELETTTTTTTTTDKPTPAPALDPTPSPTDEPSQEPSDIPVMEPSPAPVDCVTYPPTRGIYYDCNSAFISDADCFDGVRFTCESCCYTDLSVDGRRPCWTPDHSKIDCCGEGSDIAPTNPPEFGDTPICGADTTSAPETTTTATTTEEPSQAPTDAPTPSPTDGPSQKPSAMPVIEPSPAPVGCVTYPPTRGVYYECNSVFISDADCFDGVRFTCESCCYTDLSVDGRRPCWTPEHSKIDCCGEGSDIAPTNPPEFGLTSICGEDETETTEDPSPEPSASLPSDMPVMEPSPAPVECVTYPPTRGVYYDCNSDFISDADCFDGFKFTCESCCYTDSSVDGRRPCWTPDHSKIDCCGEGSDIAPTNPPDFDAPICGEETTAALETTTTTTTEEPSPSPTDAPTVMLTTSLPSDMPVMEPSAPCITYPPTRGVYYDCNSQFISDADCFAGQYTCESCCYTDMDTSGRRPCWTPDHAKIDCCGEGTDIAPTNPPDLNFCQPEFESVCECIQTNGLCSNSWDEMSSGQCGEYVQAEMTEMTPESYCYDDCLATCQGYPETNEGEIRCLKSKLRYLAEEEQRLGEMFESQQQTCDAATSRVNRCMS